ncbi:hypothetical protein [Mesorhizobium sp. M00.F.Ca.ET.216.01.1.1]|uniref:hypothetical protein n=1 Tax=Mesorhizobium sp. M00.F.Ca.ET.216.01.1.1 TaxID=2500528 RepID=UPI001FE0A6E7|nr:hypothetical protein [Mesorhizobium sp. M00.F.Ca.ET.216.01.1.1]
MRQRLCAEGHAAMVDDRQKETRKMRENKLALFMAKETGITADQARDLTAMIGIDLGSLLCEARILRKQSGQSLS